MTELADSVIPILVRFPFVAFKPQKATKKYLYSNMMGRESKSSKSMQVVLFFSYDLVGAHALAVQSC
jgi:hypothetical protein